MNIEKLYQQYYLASTSVCIDTRKVEQGSLFFALGRKDERGVHRGSQFAAEAINRGALGVIINDPDLKAQHKTDERWIWVEDVEVALQELAAFHRQQLNIPIIAIAGSNGKTTTRALMEAVLSKQYQVFSTPGNLNNHLGVPLSLLQITPQTEIAILEIGANHLGETRFLAELIQPTHGFVTNNGKDHLGEYGSFENVLKSNKELYDYFESKGQGLVLVNGEDASLLESSSALAQRLFYGRRGEDALWAELLAAPELALRIHIEEEAFEVELALFGAFWSSAVLAAVQLGLLFEVRPERIREALLAFRPASLRSQRLQWQGHQLLLDCYNANPSSMQAFLKAVEQSQEQPKILILGEMLELGSYSQTEHQNMLDAWINYEQYTHVFLIGHSFLDVQLPVQPKLKHFENIEQAIPQIQKILENATFYIYVKGSRANQLEKIFK